MEEGEQTTDVAPEAEEAPAEEEPAEDAEAPAEDVAE